MRVNEVVNGAPTRIIHVAKLNLQFRTSFSLSRKRCIASRKLYTLQTIFKQHDKGKEI
jgi:hypothetical protein